MIEVRTLNFTLRLVEASNIPLNGGGNYYIELSGESPFNVHKSFSEKFYLNSNSMPFNSLEDTATFVQETAKFWQTQMENNPKLNITGLQELTDLWAKFSLAYQEYLQFRYNSNAISA